MPEIEVTQGDYLCARRDSNPQPSDPKSEALSVELRTLKPKDTVQMGEYFDVLEPYGRSPLQVRLPDYV